MTNLNKLARALRERDNPHKIGIQVGRVISVSPIIVELEGVHAQGEHLIIAASALDDYTRKVTIDATSAAGEHNHSTPTIPTEPDHVHVDSVTDVTTLDMAFVVGDEVIVIASDNNQDFYLIDRAVRV